MKVLPSALPNKNSLDIKHVESPHVVDLSKSDWLYDGADCENKQNYFIRCLAVGVLWAVVLVEAVFVPDVGIKTVLPLVGLVVLGFWLNSIKYFNIAAGVGTAVCAVAFFKPPFSENISTEVMLFATAIFPIWVTAILCTFNKRKETVLAQTKKNLDQVVNESNEKLDQARNNLDQAYRHESKYLSAMSHELRTPLNAVIGFTDLLQGQYFGELNEKQLGYITQIDKSGKHLLDLINDLLDIAKIDAGATWLELEAFNPTECMLTVDLMKPQFKKKELEVETIIEPGLETMQRL
jgi:signal transduction histidine kinase